MAAVFIAILGAALALLGGGTLKAWQYGWDTWLSRVDKLCDLIESAAEKSASYWLDADEDGVPRKGVHPSRLKTEAEILGLITKITGICETVCLDFTVAQQKIAEDALASFLSAMTGDSFKSSVPIFSPDNARLVHSTAGDLIVVLRTYSLNRVSMKGRLEILAIICGDLHFRIRSRLEKSMIK
jgi:hypothetical protein